MGNIGIIGIVISAIGTILTGIYVYFTIKIANKTAESVETTKDAIVENHWQSEKSIAAVNRQIESSEQQAREALQNQHKPVIVPTSRLLGLNRLEMTMQNKGPGVALNTWGVITKVTTNQLYRFSSTYFLVPNKMERIFLIDITSSMDFMFPNSEFYDCSVHPPPDTGRLNTDLRLLVTYNDIFSNKYLVVFDWSDQFEWRQFEEVKQIRQRLDEYLEEKRSLVLPPQKTQ